MGTLLHIGVPKTGTTAVQAALTDLLARPGLAAETVTMPGTPAEQSKAALSVLGQGPSWRKNEAVALTTHWPRLVAQARQATGTVVVSSEFLCEAQPDVIRRIADDLGRDDLRVVVTLRPLAKILPSAWQQYLKSGHQLPYEKWLKAVLADPPKPSVTPSFWRRHDHAAVINRWAEEIGAERLTVVVLDPSDRGQLLRAFDGLLGLPVGTLTESPGDHGNRSMTAAEAELFRRINVVLRSTEVSWSEYAHLVRYGAILRAVEQYTPADDATRLSTPAWAVERATELGAGYVKAIDAQRAAGLTVVGNLDELAKPISVPTGTAVPPVDIPLDAVVEALLGVISRATVGSQYFPEEPAEAGEGLPGSDPVDLRRLPADKLTTRQLAELLSGRIRKKVRRKAARLPLIRSRKG